MDLQLQVVFLVLALVKLGSPITLDSNNVEETERVVDGAAAAEDMFPWTVALYFKNEFVCTASIISEREILTAAHCMVFNGILMFPNDYYGIIGSINKSTDGKRVKFSELIPHPKYDKLRNDIAILRTTETIPFNKATQPICLATTKLGCIKLKAVTAMGWGITTRDTSVTTTPDILRYTKLIVYPNSKCSLLYFNKVPKTVLCAGALKSGVCAGDSGGPLVYRPDKKKDELVLVGVASFVSEIFGCGTLFGPAGYTSLSSYTDFIQENTKGKVCLT